MENSGHALRNIQHIPVWNTSMEFHGNPWKSMEIHGISRNFHGMPWSSMEYPWSSMECHGVPRNAIKFHGVSFEVHGIPGNIVEFHGMPWGSLQYRCSFMECHGVSMEFDRIPGSLYEKTHRNSVIKQLINSLTTCSSLHFLFDRKIGNIWKLSQSKIVHLV